MADISMGPSLVWIDPKTGSNVYLCAEEDVTEEFCREHGISVIINVNSSSKDGPHLQWLFGQQQWTPSYVTNYNYLPFHDAPPHEQEKGMKKNAGLAVVRLMDAVKDGENVVVHCRAGVHRSAAVVYAGLTLLGHFEDRYEAYNHVSQHRCIARFYKSLCKWVAHAADDELRDRKL